MKKRQAIVAALIVIIVLVADQALKVWIKTTMELHQSIKIADWFYIYFTENNGMAFGMELIDKLYLTLFRIVAASMIGYYVVKLIRESKHSTLLVACFSLIFVGAVGNIVDSVFYGVFFEHSFGQVASFLPSGGGYETWFHGKVVDMFYFPLIQSTFPSWVPIWGGDEFVFFRPIFNIADSAISVGVFLMLVFNRQMMLGTDPKTELQEVESNEK